MYPQGALNELRGAKAALRRRISERRMQNVEHARRAGQPLVWIDSAWSMWTRLSPFVKLAAIPAGLVAARGVLPRARFLMRLIRWAPAIIGLVRNRR